MDLRQPIGILFLAYGILLAVYGLARPQPVLDLNINLIWGVVLAVFGALMLALARRSRPYTQGQAEPATKPPDHAR